MATTEVTEILGLLDFIHEASVYGVQVPGTAYITFDIYYKRDWIVYVSHVKVKMSYVSGVYSKEYI